jgi:osmotically-inducible protein OsmY
MQTCNILSVFVTTGLAIATVASARPALAEQTAARQGTASEQDTSRHQMLSRRVNAYLASSGTLAGSDIKVTAAGDVIILDGVVADSQARERVGPCVKGKRWSRRSKQFDNGSSGRR